VSGTVGGDVLGGGCVLAGGDVMGVVGGDVVTVGDFVSVGDFFGVGDFDEAGDFAVVGPTLMPWPPLPPVLTGGAVLGDALGLWASTPGWVCVGSVVLVPGPGDALPLLEISTAMIAMTPMAAAPMPANKKVRLPGLRGPGNR
jgi:hypothetical protein